MRKPQGLREKRRLGKEQETPPRPRNPAPLEQSAFLLSRITTANFSNLLCKKGRRNWFQSHREAVSTAVESAPLNINSYG